MVDVLIADDEEPALDALAFLLRADARIGVIRRAASGAEAIQLLATEQMDAAFLDIHMPALGGFDLARAISRFARPPAIVFVTADEERALGAFDLDASDFLLKPVRQERLERAVTRIIAVMAPAPLRDEFVTVTRGTTIRQVRRSDVRYVQAQGDYARLHTDDDSYLIRVPITELADRWAGAGFVRVHRSFLVSLSSIAALRLGDTPSVTAAGVDLPVSRRLLPSVRDAFEASGGVR